MAPIDATREQLKVVFAGHVDHGKSTLIGRLMYDTKSLPQDAMESVERESKQLGREVEFAFLMDHMREERDQGITIDTAQTFFKTAKRDYVIIDAPGHKEFLKNMITGASQADAAILIVDAHEGMQEQTRRHAKMLAILGIPQLVVTVNKMDLVAYDQARFHATEKDVRAFLEKVGLTPSFVIPIAAQKGENIVKPSERMPWYTGTSVLDSLDTFTRTDTRDDLPLRLPLQDVYVWGGKRIFVGRVLSGAVRAGDAVVFQPSGKSSTVKTIEKFGETPAAAHAGESIGVTLADELFLERGEVMAHPDSAPQPTADVTATVFWITTEPLRRGDDLTIQCATQERPVTVSAIEERRDSSTLETVATAADVLENTEIGTVVFTADRPLVTEPFTDIPELGRFVLMRAGTVVGGAIATHVPAQQPSR
ncbi:MAG: GTP-binding protein [Candidatus Kerfeldbacteria bacterium]|nr:GTP-binding protein [Candidatus Kerfeldbacteria bacterium]